MGAAFDARCENENLQALLNKKNRQIREQKKTIIEFSEFIIKYTQEGDVDRLFVMEDKAQKIMSKLNKKKK